MLLGKTVTLSVTHYTEGNLIKHGGKLVIGLSSIKER